MTTELLEVAELDADITLEALTGHDRCDGCRSQAFVKVRMYSGTDLLFCGHHYAKSASILEPMTLALLDKRDTINVKPSVSG